MRREHVIASLGRPARDNSAYAHAHTVAPPSRAEPRSWRQRSLCICPGCPGSMLARACHAPSAPSIKIPSQYRAGVPASLVVVRVVVVGFARARHYTNCVVSCGHAIFARLCGSAVLVQCPPRANAMFHRVAHGRQSPVTAHTHTYFNHGHASNVCTQSNAVCALAPFTFAVAAAAALEPHRTAAPPKTKRSGHI